MKLIRDRRGQAMVEMALVLPILIIFLLAIMEGGRLFASYLELENAAREGARSAAIGKNDVETAVYIKDQLRLLDPASGDLEIDIAPSTRTTGEPVSVSVYHKVNILTPLISDIIGSPFQLQARVVTRVE